MARAGLYDQLISVQRDSGTAQDDYGEPVPSWQPYQNFMARVIYGRGSEDRQASREGGVQVVTFRVARGPTALGVRARDRIVFRGLYWDVQAQRDLTQMDAVEIDAVAGETAVVREGWSLDFGEGSLSGLLALLDDDLAVPASDGSALDFSDSENSGLLALV